uniref:Uncharacterized protein n=1 Tax=Anguilla anguilla TaxID=7936 RepID=A0A0E9RF98_ANGAN
MGTYHSLLSRTHLNVCSYACMYTRVYTCTQTCSLKNCRAFTSCK